MMIVGVDPGGRGGIAWLSKDGAIERLCVMPMLTKELNEVALREIFLQTKPDVTHLFIEHSQAMECMGKVSSFKYGMNFMAIKMCAVCFQIPFTLVKPQVWQKTMHRGINPKLTTKKRSLIAAQRIFPEESFLASARSTQPHDGLYDAALIAEWGRRHTLCVEGDVA
jgi:hypothetical protein